MVPWTRLQFFNGLIRCKFHNRFHAWILTTSCCCCKKTQWKWLFWGLFTKELSFQVMPLFPVLLTLCWKLLFCITIIKFCSWVLLNSFFSCLISVKALNWGNFKYTAVCPILYFLGENLRETKPKWWNDTSFAIPFSASGGWKELEPRYFALFCFHFIRNRCSSETCWRAGSNVNSGWVQIKEGVENVYRYEGSAFRRVF